MVVLNFEIFITLTACTETDRKEKIYNQFARAQKRADILARRRTRDDCDARLPRTCGSGIKTTSPDLDKCYIRVTFT